MYFAPLSSPKPKHLKLKSKIDFLKINNGKLGAINFNNMLPVKKNNIQKINLYKKGLSVSEMKYINLLKEQIYLLNRNKKIIYKKANDLYFKYINNKLSNNIAKKLINCKSA